MTKDLQNLLEEIAKLAVHRMSEWLPAIGGDRWWKFYVYDQLSIPQQRIISEADGKLSDLDAAAIFRILGKNWKELSNHRHTGLKSSDFKFVKEAGDIRNELAHMPIGAEITIQDVLRNLDTLTRLAESLNADEGLIEKLRLDYNKAIQLSTQKSKPNKEQSEDTNKKPLDEPATKKIKTNEGKKPNSIITIQPEIASEKIDKTIYIGIDFGTSTTVVSTVQYDKKTEQISLTPLQIIQPTEFDDQLEHYLVNSVLTLHKDKLLFGSEAARLKVKYIEGEAVFSSFKMMLGLNLPNRYSQSKVKSKFTKKIIKNPQDAATEFFRFLLESIKQTLKKDLDKTDIKFSISVPASFEANQRRDLLNCLNEAGFPVESSSLIDEPNAAFLSYLYESWQKENEFVKNAIEAGEKNVLVFDFGAGTCDISILKLQVNEQSISSRNLAISRFMALGGDDIDRVIAKKYLLDKVSYSNVDLQLTQEEINQTVIPWLKPAAEELKKACSDELLQIQEDDFDNAKNVKYQATVETPDALTVRNVRLSIERPSLTMAEYVDVIKSFAQERSFQEFDDDGNQIVGEPKSIIAPITNALDKADLHPDQINAVLFIGGSAKSTLIRKAVMDNFPKSTIAIIPSDLQAHVSKGAALHCLGHYGFKQDFVQPITSEPIYLITKGASLKLIMPAGSSVPSDELFNETVLVGRDGQTRIELPICVSNENKLLGILKIVATDPSGFKKNEEISISCNITHEKLLEAKAAIRGISQTAIMMNPLTNHELSEQEIKALEAKQIFQEGLLANNGKPTAAILQTYAIALQKAGCYLEASDYYIQLELMNKSNHATSICYCLAMAGKYKQSDEWAKIAYERNKNSTTCYNYALQFRNSNKTKCEGLLEESLNYDPNYPYALRVLGELRLSDGSNDGIEYLTKAADSLANLVKTYKANAQDCNSLEQIAEKLGRDELVDLAQGRKVLLNKNTTYFNDDNLAVSDQSIISN